MIPAGNRVLELGCATGDLLASVKPAYGVGVDFSGEMIARAKRKHPGLRFVEMDVHELTLDDTFDTIILSDLVNELWDVQQVFERLQPLCTAETRIILNSYSRMWELPLALASRLNLARPVLAQNWFTVEDIRGIAALGGFEVYKHWRDIFFPFGIPFVSPLLNRFIGKLWPFHYFSLTNMIVARPQPQPLHKEPTVSVVVAARNEAGNIGEIIDRVPVMGGGTELIFVEGNSTDDTYTTIEQELHRRYDLPCKLLKQPGRGKGDAVRHGFSHATGDVLMILDADMTVPPEDLPRFYQALRERKGDFINGVRLVYPMQERAMRFFNLLGNKFFGWAFSWLLGQPVKDTLCGTKVLWRKDYERIAMNRTYFGDFDPFGDFDLLFGAAKLNLRIIDLPIRYRERKYGETNIRRWRHGMILLRMVLFAARRIKFV